MYTFFYNYFINCYNELEIDVTFAKRPNPRPRGSARRKTASSLILRGHF